MIRRIVTVCLLLAVASAAWGDTKSRLRTEARREARRRQRSMTVEERWADRTIREIEAEHRRLIRREAEIAPDYRTEASLIYLDRERAANRDPFELLRERDRRLAAERFKIDGLRYYTLSDYRMGSESRVMAIRRGYGAGYLGALRNAENWAIEGAGDVFWAEEQRRQRIIRRVLALAERMDLEAQGREPQPPKRAAWRRFLDFMTEPFRRE